MTPQLFLDGKVKLFAGDCREALTHLPENSIDSCVTDPPYHLTSIVKRFANDKSHLSVSADKDLETIKAPHYKRLSRGFMGKQWDGGDIAFDPDTWRLVLRVLKPGAHLLAFGGTRTYHLLTYGIESAGFEIRDAIMWHYGSGFPKSHDISKSIDRVAGVERLVVGSERNWGKRPEIGPEGHCGEWDITEPASDAAKEWNGWGTALKPATEIICLARKPLSEKNIAANVLKWGVGALNIDGCRVACAQGDKGEWPITKRRHDDKTWTVQPVHTDQSRGRWPANLLLTVPEDEYELRAFTSSEQKRELFRWLSENA